METRRTPKAPLCGSPIPLPACPEACCATVRPPAQADRRSALRDLIAGLSFARHRAANACEAQRYAMDSQQEECGCVSTTQVREAITLEEQLEALAELSMKVESELATLEAAAVAS